jgi:hypothetical protein
VIEDGGIKEPFDLQDFKPPKEAGTFSSGAHPVRETGPGDFGWCVEPPFVLWNFNTPTEVGDFSYGVNLFGRHEVQ